MGLLPSPCCNLFVISGIFQKKKISSSAKSIRVAHNSCYTTDTVIVLKEMIVFSLMLASCPYFV